IQFSLQQLGKPYDDPFLYDNGKYYCSELIYDAFAFANNGKPFFQLEPMTFKQPNSTSYFPVWIEYYQKLNIPIPEGKPGINPGGISRSDKIEFLK
ncbi:MAG: YiiX/YebB-like N1pC/P60 family cysteine hydrolase, partial [Bacteroidota bacterium]